MLTPPLPWDRPKWRERGGETVVLLHGLWRGWRAMEPLARHLASQGFSTLNVPYPSARLPVPALAEHVRRQVAKVAGDRPVHFVTHSLGGILARTLLADPLPWQAGRLLMLAPPNQGSEIVDWASAHPWALRLLGPAGGALGKNGIPSSLPPLPEAMDAAVIMGKRPGIPFFRKLLEEENDGIVSAAGGRIAGLRGFMILDADHTFIPMHSEVIRICPSFLKSGAWPDQDRPSGFLR